MENLKLNHANMEINLLTKQLGQWKQDYGELLLSNSDIQKQLALLTHERDDLHHKLAASEDRSKLIKGEFEVKIKGFETEIQMLKKQNQHLSAENASLEANKGKYDEELRVLRMKVARFEEEKEEILKKKSEENSRVSAKNDKLKRELSAVLDVVGDKFRIFQSRITDLEKDVDDLKLNSFPLDSHLGTPQVVQEQESFGPEAKFGCLVGAQSGPESTPIEEKTASSMPSRRVVTATCGKKHEESSVSKARPARLVGTEERSASSMPVNRKSLSATSVVDLSSSDDDGDPPSPKGLKRKLQSSDTSYKMGDGGSSSEQMFKEQNDLSPEALNPLRKTVAPLKQCEQNFYKWDYEADLLDDLQNDTELCMKGVCALYRQHMLCTIRETSLAKSLIGDASNELRKSSADFEIDRDECKRIALGHSKQLFELYINGNDPVFAHGIISS